MDHFLTIFDLTEAKMNGIINRAAELKLLRKEGALPKPLAGQNWALIFEKSSTRTRVSFEVGVNLLGGNAFYLSPDQIQLGRGEPLEDTARVLSRYVDGLIVRTFGHDRVATLAEWGTIPVINGLTDLCHPCQLLADLLTIQERLGTVTDFKSAWIGDGNNMAYSWIASAAVLGFTLTLACPPGYDPDPAVLAKAEEMGARVEVVRDPAQAVAGADVINTDVFTSMGQEAETAQRMEAFAGFQINQELVDRAGPKAIVLHCLPAHRGEEITEEVLEGPRSAVFDQAENRLHAQMAVLEALSGQQRKADGT